jgi:putative membrane protein
MPTARLVFVALGAALLSLGVSHVTAQTVPVPRPEEFINRAAVSGIYEVEAGKIAINKTQNAELKAFALIMVVDHTDAGEELKKVAGKFPVPSALDSAHQDLIARLNDAKPGEFDRLYWEQQSIAHKDAVSLFTQYSTEGANGAEKGFAAKTLPVLQHHQEMLGLLESKIAN